MFRDDPTSKNSMGYAVGIRTMGAKGPSKNTIVGCPSPLLSRRSQNGRDFADLGEEEG